MPSGVFEFPTDAENLEQASDRILQEADCQQYLDWTPLQRQQKNLEIQTLLEKNHQTPERRARLLLEQGNLFLASQNNEAAIASYDRALALKPDNNAVWNNRGYALANLGRYEKAIASHEKVLEIRRKVGDRKGEAASLQALAGLYNKMGRVREGFVTGQQAMQILLDLDLPLEEMPYPNWLKAGMKFAGRGKLQTAMMISCAIIIAPFFLVWLIILSLWRMIIAPFNRHRSSR